MKHKHFIKKSISLLLAASMIMSIGAVGTKQVKAENPTLSFPEVYPDDKLIIFSAEEIEKRVYALLKSMTEDEMYGMLGGGQKERFGTGYAKGVPRLGVPELRMWDGPKGVEGNGIYETSAPSSELSVASSFDKELAVKYGELHGSDNKAYAGNIQLGIQVDNVRAPFFMRARDSFGEDPFLSAVMATEVSRGVEKQNVMSTLKHLAAYTSMYTYLDDNMIIDEQALHEIYLTPYETAVKAGTASAVMSSFNLINGVQANENTYIQKDVLRDMWGFKGVTMTDWNANKKVTTHLGTDFEMPTTKWNNKTNIEIAIEEGKMTKTDILTAVGHTLTAMGQIGYLGLVVVNPDGTAAADTNPRDSIQLKLMNSPEERKALMIENDKITLESAIKGAVLLKNEESALPVTKDESIAVIGLTGLYTLTGTYMESSFGWLNSMTSPFESMQEILGDEANISVEAAFDIEGKMIPDEYLFITDGSIVESKQAGDSDDEQSIISQLEPQNGVNLKIDGETTLVNNINFTTGTINGKTNRTYKNSDDGTAFIKGKKTNITTYLKAPETGEYEFKLLGIAGSTDAKITVDTVEKTVPSDKSSGDPSTLPGAGNTDRVKWGEANIVPSKEGMNIPAEILPSPMAPNDPGMPETLKLNLLKDEFYKIEIDTEAFMDTRDQQLRLTWYTPTQRQDNYNNTIELAKTNDKVIIFAHDLGMGNSGFFNMMHRADLALDTEQVKLIQDVSQAAKEAGNKVIVVLNISLPVTMDWIDDVDAVLNMWLAGQAGGKATAQLLTGIENPSGKLSVTFPVTKNDTQFGDYSNFILNPTIKPGGNPQNPFDLEVDVPINEGIFSGYRWYDKEDIKPLFDFGHGLSYTDFTYSDLQITRIAGKEYDYNVTFTVKNTGTVAGSEVAQIYIGKTTNVPDHIQIAERQLAGFERIDDLAPEQSKTVTIELSEQSLSYWDKNAPLRTREDGTKDKRVVATGSREVEISSASDDIRLTKVLEVRESTKLVVSSATTTNSATLSWKVVEGAVYTIYQKIGEEFKPLTLQPTIENDIVTVTIVGLTSSSVYEFQVSALLDSDTFVSNIIKVQTKQVTNTGGNTSSGGGSNPGSGKGDQNAGILPETITSTTTTITPPTIITEEKTPEGVVEQDPMKGFSDVPDGHWASHFIKYLSDTRIMVGDGAGNFEPNRALTRAEFAMVIYKAFDLKLVDGARDFTDIKQGVWYTDAIKILSSNKIINGDPGGTFRPADAITREEMAMIMYNLIKSKGYDLPQTRTSKFADLESSTDFAKEIINTLYNIGILNGMDESGANFAPKKTLTRAETSSVIYNFIMKIKDK